MHLKEIPGLLFYDGDDVISMSCEEFVTSHFKTVEERFGQLTHMITQVEAA